MSNELETALPTDVTEFFIDASQVTFTPEEQKAFEKLDASFDYNFPQSCLKTEYETDLEYQKFLYFICMGYKRTLVGVANRFRKPGSPIVVSDYKMKSANTKWLDKRYILIWQISKDNDWKARANDWDNYIANQTLARAASLMQHASLMAVETFIDVMENGKHDSDKINAAKSVLAQVMPTSHITKAEIDVTVTNIKQASEEELRALVALGLSKMHALEGTAKVINKEPEPFKLPDQVEVPFLKEPEPGVSFSETIQKVSEAVNDEWNKLDLNGLI